MKTVEQLKTVTKNVDISQVVPDPNQPRQEFDAEEMKKLIASIRDRGIMSPITVEPEKNGKYLIIDGERRFRAAQTIRLKIVPVNVLNKNLSAAERNIIRFQLQETHKNWTPFEKADAMRELKDGLSLTNEELAQALAVAKVTVDRYLNILAFSPRVRAKLTAVKMPFSYMESLSYTHNIMPEKIQKAVPDYIDNIVEKFKKGLIKSHRDFAIVNRLIKKGEYKTVIKFLQNNTYTATNALMDSGDEADQLITALTNRARRLTLDLNIVHRNKVHIPAETKYVLNELGKLL